LKEFFFLLHSLNIVFFFIKQSIQNLNYVSHSCSNKIMKLSFLIFRGHLLAKPWFFGWLFFSTNLSFFLTFLPFISTAFNLFNVSLYLSQPDAYIHSLLARAYNHPTSLKVKLARGFIRRLSQHPCRPPIRRDCKNLHTASLRFRRG
jgi:hypothetical protein